MSILLLALWLYIKIYVISASLSADQFLEKFTSMPFLQRSSHKITGSKLHTFSFVNCSTSHLIFITNMKRIPE